MFFSSHDHSQLGCSHRPITDAQRRMIDEGSPLSSFFPMQFENGQTIDNLVTYCKSCDHEIDDFNTRFTLVEPVNSVRVLSGLSACRRCRLATPFHYRIYPDGRIVFPSRENNSWVQIKLFQRIWPAWWDLAGWITSAPRLARRTLARRLR